MTRLARLLLLAAVFPILPCQGQVCDPRTSGSAIQMRIQLTFDDRAPESAPGAVATQNDPLHRGDSVGNQRGHDFTSMHLQVQLQDPSGGTLQEQMPTSDGQVRMMVCKRLVYRLRVIGRTIDEAVLDSVQPGQGDSLVTVVLHRKLTQEERKSNKTTVSARGLRIPKKAQAQVEKGDAALQQLRLEDAEKYYSKAIRIYPQFEEAENSLGVVLMQEGRKGEGRAAFERALASNPQYAPAFVNLGKIAVDERRFDDANVLAKKALRSEPLNPGALFVAAESAFFKKDYAETTAYARTLHSLPHKQYGLVHYLAAKSLEAQQQPAGAIVEYQTFLEEDPQDPNAERARKVVSLLQAAAAPAQFQSSNR
jgi:hypothetical protein